MLRIQRISKHQTIMRKINIQNLNEQTYESSIPSLTWQSLTADDYFRPIFVNVRQRLRSRRSVTIVDSKTTSGSPQSFQLHWPHGSSRAFGQVSLPICRNDFGWSLLIVSTGIQLRKLAVDCCNDFLMNSEAQRPVWSTVGLGNRIGWTTFFFAYTRDIDSQFCRI